MTANRTLMVLAGGGTHLFTTVARSHRETRSNAFLRASVSLWLKGLHA